LALARKTAGKSSHVVRIGKEAFYRQLETGLDERDMAQRDGTGCRLSAFGAANYMFLGYYPEMAWDDGLVGTAREIAATDRTPLRVMAGPGTGKSFAMKRRVARLLEGGHRQLFANAAIAASRVAS
jgi:hypothetical protein